MEKMNGVFTSGTWLLRSTETTEQHLITRLKISSFQAHTQLTAVKAKREIQSSWESNEALQLTFSYRTQEKRSHSVSAGKQWTGDPPSRGAENKEITLHTLLCMISSDEPLRAELNL